MWVGGEGDRRSLNELFCFTRYDAQMEALSGTLITAKKQNIISYEGQLLMQRVHDDATIILLVDDFQGSTIGDYMPHRQAEVDRRENDYSRLGRHHSSQDDPPRIKLTSLH